MRYLLWLFLLVVSCAPSRFVEPLEPKQQAVGFSAGGPAIDYGSLIIPTPLSSVNYGFGIDTGITLYGGLHTTSLLFGNLQLDVGGTFKLLDQYRFAPNVSVSPALNFITRFGPETTNLWPAVDVNAYWNYGKREHFFYVGMLNWFEPRGTRSHGEPVIRNYIWNPQIGHTWKIKALRLTTEVKLLAPDEGNELQFVPYRSATGSKGATGIYINISKVF